MSYCCLAGDAAADDPSARTTTCEGEKGSGDGGASERRTERDSRGESGAGVAGGAGSSGWRTGSGDGRGVPRKPSRQNLATGAGPRGPGRAPEATGTHHVPLEGLLGDDAREATEEVPCRR